MRRIIVSTVLALVLVVSAAVPAFAYSTTADVTVSATPALISISNAPDAWTMNDSGATTPGDDVIRKATTYWSNDEDNTTSPTATVDATECRFTVTNDGTVPVDIEISMSDFSGGTAAMTNRNTGCAAAASAGEFGAEVYLVGAAIADAVAITVAGTADVIANLPDTTSNTKDWGLEILTQSDDFTDATLTESTVTLTATEYTG